MQPRQMADSFFGFDSTSLGAGLDDGLDCLDDEDFNDENYDALNDETFGSEANAGDWERDHEKLAEIAESSRPRNRHDYSKSESEIDVEKSLSHLVIDEKEVTIPRPGVWDSPTNFPIPPPQIRPKPSLTTALKNACTVEELERGLMSSQTTSRPPPGLIKQPGSSAAPGSQPQPQTTTSGGNLFLNSIASSVEKIQQQINGIVPPSNQFPLPILPPNVRLTHPQFHLQNVRPLGNQPGNLLRYPLPLLLPGGQRQPPLHGNFPLNNFPHPSNAGLGPLPYMRPDHPLMPPYPNNHQSMQQHHMHMGNQRNQNKPFNHNDRQDNHHQPFFKNNQYHQNQSHLNRYHQNQGHHGYQQQQQQQYMNHHQNHNHSSSNGVGPSGEHDEYAGLMNNREKQWLNNIQLLQLNTNQPYIDDYYYTVFCDRMNKKNELRNRNRAAAANANNKKPNGKSPGNNNNNNNNGYHRDSRDREQPQHTFTTKLTTTPMQFENSLGKLQYSSVTAPRKIIDMDVVPNSDPQQAPSVQQKDTKKTRQLLLEIERLYMLLLKLEDKNNPLAIIADQQREQQQREQQQQQQQENGEVLPPPERKDPVREKEELILSIMTSLLQFVQDDKFSSLLSIRKGKTLFLRFLTCIDVKENELKLAKLWAGVIKGLSIIGRRDSNLLINFYTELQKWVEENCISLLLMNLAKEFIESANQPSKSNSLTFALTNKFGISVIALMLKHAMETSSYAPSELEPFVEHWSRFLRACAESMGSSQQHQPIVAPCETLEVDALRTHLRRHGIHGEPQIVAFELYFTEANPAR